MALALVACVACAPDAVPSGSTTDAAGTGTGSTAAAPAGAVLDPAHAPVAEVLRAAVTREMEAHDLPAVAIALVDDQRIVWAEGFGTNRPFDGDGERLRAAGEPIPAGDRVGPGTVFRVGSVSKLFTDIAVMQRVEVGDVDLDAPVTRYLPGFDPGNESGSPITLRQLMSHRSGLVREPPVGHYFDPTEPGLTETVLSLNDTVLVYPPARRTKYSNAGIAAVGYALEVMEGLPFAEVLRRDVLAPLAMDSSAFEPTPAVRGGLAGAVMWTLDGREFPAPTFELGMAPAGSMYSTVEDLGRFLSALFAGGAGERGRILEAATLEEMWTPQLAPAGAEEGFGIGFDVSRLNGHRRVGHGGAIYGFATELAALPDERLGAVVVTTRDIANAVTTALADAALRAMLAHRAGEPVPAPDAVPPLMDGLAERIAGRGEHHDPEPPAAPPARWRGLVGEYGWDHDVLYVLEMEGRLTALIEWFFPYPLEELGPDRFRFPDGGLYAGEELVFQRDPGGEALSVQVGGVTFERRAGAADGETFRIDPVTPVEELRPVALSATPPAEEGDFREPDLVEIAPLDPTIRLDIRYATTNNFMGAVFYDEPRAFLQRPAAEALVRAHGALRERGYGLLIFDAYRPWYVTKMFWDATPASQKQFVADPASGSRHNRGSAVDLTLYDLATGEPVPMTGGYDEFTARSYPDYPGGTSRQRWHRELLRAAMEAEGFTVYEWEWWHFDHEDWREYPILNLTFDRIAPSPDPAPVGAGADGQDAGRRRAHDEATLFAAPPLSARRAGTTAHRR